MTTGSPVGATACEHAFCAKYPHLAATRHELEAENFGSIDELRERLATAEARAVAAEIERNVAREHLARADHDVMQVISQRNGARASLSAAEGLLSSMPILEDELRAALADAAALREQLADVSASQTYWREASEDWSRQMAEARNQLRTAEALALTNGERVTRAEALLERLGATYDSGPRCACCQQWVSACDAVSLNYQPDQVAWCAGREARRFLAAFLAPTEPDGASAAIPEGTPTATKSGDE